VAARRPQTARPQARRWHISAYFMHGYTSSPSGFLCHVTAHLVGMARLIGAAWPTTGTWATKPASNLG
jgi:hypothetical protein